MVMLLTTLLTPLMSVASLVTSVFSAAFLAMPLTVTTPSVVPTLVLTELVERCDSNATLTWALMEASSIVSTTVSSALAGVLTTVITFVTRKTRSEEHTSELQSHRYLHSFPTRRSSDLLDLGADGGVINCLDHRFIRLGRGLDHRHHIRYTQDPFDVFGIFGCQLPLCLARGCAAQGDHAISDIHLRLAAAHVAMQRQYAAHFRPDPGIRFLSALQFDFQSIVHPLDTRKACHGFLGQVLVACFVDLPGQGDDAIPGLGLDCVILKVGFVRV